MNLALSGRELFVKAGMKDTDMALFAAGIVLLWLAAFAGVLYALHSWASPSWKVLATAARGVQS
jgi:hypothetical protein